MAEPRPLAGQHALVTGNEARAALTGRNPQQRVVTADEVAAAVNGQAISVSGGEVMVG